MLLAELTHLLANVLPYSSMWLGTRLQEPSSELRNSLRAISYLESQSKENLGEDIGSSKGWRTHDISWTPCTLQEKNQQSWQVLEGKYFDHSRLEVLVMGPYARKRLSEPVKWAWFVFKTHFWILSTECFYVHSYVLYKLSGMLQLASRTTEVEMKLGNGIRITLRKGKFALNFWSLKRKLAFAFVQ